jgi:hypothetical protein
MISADAILQQNPKSNARVVEELGGMDIADLDFPLLGEKAGSEPETVGMRSVGAEEEEQAQMQVDTDCSQEPW